MDTSRQTLREHDVTDLIGLRVVVANTAHEIIEDDGSISVEVPGIEALSAAAAIARCLMPVRLDGCELRVIRRIVGWTATDLAAKLGEKTSAETISRWENDKQPMGGYAEKVFRLVVCEELAAKAPGIGYKASAIANLIVIDLRRADHDITVPPLVFEWVKVMRNDEGITSEWEYDAPTLKAA